MSDTLVKNITAHGKGCSGCQRTERDVMVSYMVEGSDAVHDLFLTYEQAEELARRLAALSVDPWAPSA